MMNFPLPSALIQDRNLERPHQRDGAAGWLCKHRDREYLVSSASGVSVVTVREGLHNRS